MTAYSSSVHMPGLKSSGGKSYAVFFELEDIGDDASEPGIHYMNFVEETGEFDNTELYIVGEYWG